MRRMNRSLRAAVGAGGLAALVAASSVAGVQHFSSLERRFKKELAALGLPGDPGWTEIVTEEDLEALPPAARRYMRFMRVTGRPRDWSFQCRLAGEFRRSPEDAFLAMEAWQYDSAPAMARVFHLRIRMFGVIPVTGRDTYLGGRGRMLIRPLDLFDAQDATGMELDVGELVTYLNDAILAAPSLLLGPQTRWIDAGPDAFDVELTDDALTVKARVEIDERGAPRTFITTDRFVEDPYDPRRSWVRARWSTPIAGWTEVDGRMLPTEGAAVWHLPQGDFTYGRLRFDAATARFNVPPNG